MATSTSTPTFLCSSTQRNSIQFTISSSPSTLPWPKTPKSRFSIPATQLGFGLFSPWSGLKHLGISIKHKSIKIERRGGSRGKVVYASLFGVGAPEALVIGVVALLVFGPKGLAEVARTLGKTFRSFQPTIRELQEVSREFKTTLEREIGLDDVPPSVQKDTSISVPPATSTPANTETLDRNDVPSATESLNIGEFLVETQRKSSARQQEELSVPQEAQTLPQSGSQEAQLKSAAPQHQEQLIPQEAQSQPQPESQETAPTTPQTKHES